MQTIIARNAHQALPEVMYLLSTQGRVQESRNGRVCKVPGPVTIKYEKPHERVIFWPERDANPFFHILEALWMLAGRNDVAFVAGIVPGMAKFSDDGRTLNAAYGHRWRRHFGGDQLVPIAEALKKDRFDRRQVLQMWDAKHDLGSGSKDLPCNTQVYFSRTDTGALDMTVTNRSNDAVWGALGANVVHFSVLQEYMAAMIGCSVGKYWQVTNNLHLYLDAHEGIMNALAAKYCVGKHKSTCPYESGAVQPIALIPAGHVTKFDADLAMLLDEGPALGMTDWFCRKVAGPLLDAIATYKSKDDSKDMRIDAAQRIVGSLPIGSDWAQACGEWLERRRV